MRGGGSVTVSVWPGTGGVQSQFSATTYSNTTGSASQAWCNQISFTGGTFTSTTPSTVYGNACTVYINSAPTPSTNVTMTARFALLINSGMFKTNDTTDASSISTGTIVSTGGIACAKKLWCGTLAVVPSATVDSVAWSNVGPCFNVAVTTVRNTSSAASTVIGLAGMSSFQRPAISATNANITYTMAANVYIAGGPTASTNVTITNPIALYVASSATSVFTGPVAFGGSIQPTYFMDCGSVGAPPAMAINFYGGTRGNGGGNNAINYMCDAAHRWWYGTSAQGGAVSTNPTGTNTMTLLTSGYLGLGITTPIYPLDINLTFNTNYNPGATYGRLNSSGATSIASPDNNVNFSIRCTGAISCTAVYASSDRRIKKDIQTISNKDAMSFVKDVVPVMYQLKESEEECFGYIAQDILRVGNTKLNRIVNVIKKDDVEEQIEEDGFINPKDHIFNVAYTDTIPLLHNVIKQLLQRIEVLEQKLGVDPATD